MSLLKAMLDTNIVSALMRSPKSGRVHDRLVAFGMERVCISIITSAEIQFGFAKRHSPRLEETLHYLLAGIEVLPFDMPADFSYGQLRAHLENEGRLIVEAMKVVHPGMR